MPRSPALAIQARQRSRVLARAGAERADPVGRALGDEEALAAALGDDRKPPALEVERDLVELAPARVVRRPWTTPRMAASSGLRMPVSKRLLRRASASGRGFGSPSGPYEPSTRISPTVSVPVLSLHRTSMLPEVLDRREVLDDDVLVAPSATRPARASRW